MSNKITTTVAAVTLAAATLLTTSCTKDNSIITSASTTRQLTGIEQDANNACNLVYNSDNLVSKITNKENGTSEYIDITYNAQKKPVQASLNTLVLKFIYTNNELTKVEYHDATLTGAVTFYSEFTNQNGKMTEMRTYAVSAGTTLPDFKITYTYNAAGDVTSAKQYLWASTTNAYSLMETTSYDYDDKINPLYSSSEVSQVFFQVHSIHNVVKETVTDVLNQVTANTTYAYTYDAKSYPATAVKKSTSQANPNIVTSQLKFTYNN